MSIINAVFENGVFRPLDPVAIPDHQHVQLKVEQASELQLAQPTFPRMTPGVYPEEDEAFSDSDYEYRSVPPKAIFYVQAT
ncbi:MAG: antitoxin family protein [Gemmataceae bacterium]